MLALGLIEVIGLPPAMEAADAALKAANVTLIAIAKADAGILTIEITGDVGAVTAAVDAGAAAASRIGTLRAKHVIPRVDESLVGKVITEGTKLFQPKRKVTQNLTTIKTNSSMVSESYTNLPSDEVRSNEISYDYTTTEDTTVNRNNINADNDDSNDDSYYEDKNTSDSNNTDVNNTNTNSAESNYADTSNVNTINNDQEDKKLGVEKYTAAELKRLNNDALRDILRKNGVEITTQHENAKKQELIQLILTVQNNR